MPAKIDLTLSLPDGDVTAKRNYPLAQERRDLSDPGRQADEHDWVAAELPGAIEQLYARAGLAHPEDRFRHLLTLLGGGVDHTPEVLEAVVTSFQTLRSAIDETLRELGIDPRRAGFGQREHVARLATAAADLPGITRDTLAGLRGRLASAATAADERGELLDKVKQALGLDTPQSEALADTDLPAAVARALGGPEGNPSGQVVTKLLATYRLPETLADDAVFSALQQARREEVAKAVREAIDDTKKVIFDDLADRFDLPSDSPDLIKNIDDAFTEYKNLGDDVLGKEYRRGQLDVLEALDVDASQLPAEADLAEWAARARATWTQEDTAGVRAELEVYRGHLADLLADLGVGKPKRHQDVRTGALHAADLATLVNAARSTTGHLHENRRLADRMAREFNRLLDFFELPAATPVEKLASRVIDAATKAVGTASDAARDTARRTVEAEVELLRTAVTASGELTHALTSMEGATIRNGVAVETLREKLARVRKVEVDRVAELAVLRSLAAEVAKIAGASMENQSRYSSGQLTAQQLANELRDVKANLRKDLRAAELDATRRILADVAVQLGAPELGEIYLPGAVADLKRTVEAQAVVIRDVKAVLSDLRGGLGCVDEQLAGVIRHTVLAERYPVGSVAELTNGNLVVISGITENAASILPIEVQNEAGQRMGVRISEIKGVERSRPGEFYTGDGRKAKAFKLPENGLAEILKNAPWTESSPTRSKVEEAAGALADTIERAGEGLAERLGRWADRVVAEIEETVEQNRKDGES